MNPDSLRHGIIILFALIISLSVHELCHALAAYLLGDNTAKDEGRISLNPMVHLDPMGTVFMAMMAFSGMGIGWAKPVPVNPFNFKKIRSAMVIVSAAGPLSNLIMAFIGYLVIFILAAINPQAPSASLYLLMDFLRAFGMVNISLFLFNMLPLYPLDGSKILSGILPLHLARKFDMYTIQWGAKPMMILIIWELILPIPGPIGIILGPMYQFVVKIIVSFYTQIFGLFS